MASAKELDALLVQKQLKTKKSNKKQKRKAKKAQDNQRDYAA